MRIERFRWANSQPLTRDYIDNFAKVSALYEYNPWDKDSDRQRALWLDRDDRPQADRDELVKVLERFNRGVGNSSEAMENIKALADKETLAVVGGQQAGLFSGPLLALYKAITLIAEARNAERLLGRRVVPVFWIAGEDHDIDEVNHTYLLTDELKVQRVRLNAEPEKRSSVSRWHVPQEAWEDAISQLDAALMNTEFKPDLLAILRSVCESSATLSDQFARLMARWFGRYGLILVDSDDPGLRRLESAMFRQLADRNRELSGTLLAAKDKLESSGYSAQVEILPEQAHLFVHHDGERIPLHVHGERYMDRKGRVDFSAESLLALAESEPEKLSNNVMTRPLMQDYLFPVLSTVLGPSEIAYWGLLREAFQLFGLQMPILVPRFEFTLLEGTVQKQMDKFGLGFEDVIFRLESKKEDWLKAQGSLKVEELFAETKKKFSDLYAPVVEQVAVINPGLRKLGETNMQKMLDQISFLEAKASDAFRSQHDAALRHWERIRLSVLPNGRPQERVFNVCHYWNKYGERWLDALAELPLERDGMHRIVYF
jgi:bacillithiol biosynthesis cysteine-adding enzyme BshC